MQDATFVVMFAVANMCGFSAQYAYWTNLVGAHVDWLEMTGSSAACLAVYVLDRMVPSPEDAPTAYRRRGTSAAARNVFALSTLYVVMCGALKPHIIKNTVIALPFGMAYCFRGASIKMAFIGAKNVYVSLMWMCWFFGAARVIPPDVHRVHIYAAYLAHMLLSNCIMDVKDIDGDRAHRIPTLPAMVGRGHIRALLTAYVVALGVVGSRVDWTLAVAYACFIPIMRSANLEDGMSASLCVLSLMGLPQCVRMTLA